MSAPDAMSAPEGVSAPEAAPYETLAGLFERQLEALGEGRLDEVTQLGVDCAELIAGLPASPPAAARAALERAALMQKRVIVEVMRSREAVLLELAKIEQVRRAADGYAPARRRSSRVETSA